MTAKDKLLGREDLWAGDPWLNLFRGPKLPKPHFWWGVAFGVFLMWLIFL